jgi:hypothetical protein
MIYLNYTAECNVQTITPASIKEKLNFIILKKPKFKFIAYKIHVRFHVILVKLIHVNLAHALTQIVIPNVIVCQALLENIVIPKLFKVTFLKQKIRSKFILF